ncbi:zinc finger domain-containing protein [Mycolicibacter arupensis]|uniref:zinc finger domain-containing protein n=1 Tax=Mycolicibacter arupensis TaxID=342002 RepID=UPI000A82448A
MTGRAVLAAYRDTGALTVRCGHCGAEGGQPCTKADGRISRVPCVGRLAAADLRSPGVVGEYQNSHDFSEARHPREDQA